MKITIALVTMSYIIIQLHTIIELHTDKTIFSTISRLIVAVTIMIRRLLPLC